MYVCMIKMEIYRVWTRCDSVIYQCVFYKSLECKTVRLCQMKNEYEVSLISHIKLPYTNLSINIKTFKISIYSFHVLQKKNKCDL